MARTFPGRLESVGFGKQTDPNTSVAPGFWLPHMSIKLDPQTTKADNTSALGRLEDVNDSAITGQMMDGSISAKVSDTAFGLLLLNMLGSEVVAVKETTAYNHTFTLNNSALPPYLTFTRANPNATRRFGLGDVTELELKCAQGEWAMLTGNVSAKAGVTSADVPAYPSPLENEFTSKHITVKLASNTAGLSGATALDIKSFSLKLSSKSDAWVPFGGIDPTSFDPNEFVVTGQLVLRYSDTTLETLGQANTRQALSIALVNNDVTIGASSNPSLVFTMPKVRLSPIDLSDDLNSVLTQTYTFKAELDTVAGAMITAVLTNTRATAY